MAEVKWIKITTDMFDNRKIRHLRKLPEGNNIVLIWVMLLTLAGRCNASGMIFLTANIPYTPKMLADELEFEESTVVLALEALERFGMIQNMDSGVINITGWQEYQNIEGMEKIKEQTRKRVAKHRENQKRLACNVTSNATVTQSNAIDIDKEREKEREEDKKENKSVRETTPTLFQRLAPDYQLSDCVIDKLSEWMMYKIERREPYKEMGMKSLLRQIENNVTKYGDKAVCNLIDECMASNWKGIIFDRLTKEQAKAKGGRLDWIDSIDVEVGDGF